MMKKERHPMLIMLLIGCFLASMLCFSACGGTPEEETVEETTVLSVEELMDIAFADSGFGMSAASDIKVGLSKDGIRTVTFNIQDAAYSYDINETTGEIVNSTKPEVAPDVDVDPVSLAMSKISSEVPNFQNATNIKAKKTEIDGKEIVVVTFDIEGESVEYNYDIESGKVSKK